MIQLKILFFAKSRELVGKDYAILTVPEKISYGHLLDIVVKEYSLELIKDSIILALNEEFCTEKEFEIRPGDELALTPEKLSVDEVMECIKSPTSGAISVFVGTTRDNFEGKKVLRLEYEAYDTMAYKAMKKICIEIRDKWKNIENIGMYHRLGTVPVSESSVVIAISSPHRSDALEATQWCIDALKKTVPIWKKEIYDDETREWKENKECHWSKRIKEFNETKNKNDLFKLSKNDIIPSQLIQITCSSADLSKRIETFMERKREQVNIMNVRDFCGSKTEEEGCARTNSVLVKRKNSKTHLKVARVFNIYGPRSNISRSEDTGQKFVASCTNPVDERLRNLESRLNVLQPVPKDVYSRIKEIEDRMLYLESISPEYKQFWNNKNIFQSTEQPKPCKRKYSVGDLDHLLLELENQNKN